MIIYTMVQHIFIFKKYFNLFPHTVLYMYLLFVGHV